MPLIDPVVPNIDFSQLANLGNVYQTAQKDALKQRTLASLGQGGQADSQALLRSGDLSLAQLGINMQNHQQELARQAQQDARQSSRDKIGDQHWAASYELQKQAAARKDESPLDQANRRIDVLKANGIDPNSPEGRTYAIGGSFTDPNLPKVLSPGAAVVRPGTGEVITKNGGDALLDEDTIGALAQQARAGDTTVFQNLGRGAQGAENIVKLRKEIVRQNNEGGVSGSEQALRNAEMAGVKAGQRTIGTKGANIEMAATEFNQVLPVVQQASAAVSRTNYPDLNKIIQMGQAKTGDPNVVKFGGGVNTLVNLYARAISPTGTPTVSDKDHAREILSAAWSQGQFDGAVGMMQNEIKAALSSPEKVRDEMRSRFLRGQGAAPVGYPAPGEAPAKAPVKIDGYTITEH